jgi:hypothetical protein
MDDLEFGRNRSSLHRRNTICHESTEFQCSTYTDAVGHCSLIRNSVALNGAKYSREHHQGLRNVRDVTYLMGKI